MATSLLIRNGLLIDPDPVPVVRSGDVLVEDGVIAAVETSLPDVPGAEVIDAMDRIVMPGFVDTHRHTWQAGIRSVAPDVTFAKYLGRVLGELAPRYRPEDAYIGNLAGALECLDGGVTTLLDWSHVQLTPAHTDAVVDALRRSGIRAVFGYCYGGDGGPQGLAAEGRRVRDRYFGGSDGLLSMAVAALGPEIAGEELALHEWRLARDLDLPLSVHMGGHGAESAERGLAFLVKNDLLGPRTTFVHPNFYTDDALRRIADSGGTASVSPFVEAELGIGHPATGRARANGVPTALGADTVASGPGDMFSVMRAAYALERARPEGAGTDFTTGDVLRMATIEGARVAGLGEVTGSLTPGKQADLVLLRADTLGMAPVHDPIAAVVLSADRGAVDTVLVGGRVVKRDGVLCHHDVPALLAALTESAGHLVATG
ncbi:TRZ/ATZ family hydrolase [Sphaerisporangium siamense]|uniref:Cytosine/adenosine deaminase-related metal-dependent hydrolase n=1 Tax=Sphaerisporangium siamense TaxID=795645 RepID=A0A7W7DGA0_9ACTN|nr:amidohydrolase family protein [Sphaerisporangium siamense]MBB4705455.1 cytosine/adenosine deaminase-related metal-dependent hydrolase [Sphaerisporangium siamense]GII86393.1 TRZ/ATZ family hydrolase [Sphaerisporangium siamense]